MSDEKTILAIDPGSCKCGVAVVRGGAEVTVLHRAVVATEQIAAILRTLCDTHHPDIILLGNGTTANHLAETASQLGLELRLVDEKLTSVAASGRYFIENPPRGLRRLIPTSMQTPPEPYDDYVAVILAERYLA